MLLICTSVIFLLLYGALLYFYRKGWKGQASYSRRDAPPSTITVIVPARNEAANIAALLTAIQQQSYPEQYFDVIIVDDFSTDETALAVQPFLSERVTLIRPDSAESESSKKKAIESAVAIARGELIVATDADCIPPLNWLQTINSFYKETGAQFIAAPVKFTSDNSILQLFQALDFMVLQGLTAASVSSNFHNMCNGANLAYTRKSFEEAEGFKGIDKIASGDDMLLMHKIWKLYPQSVKYLKSREAIVLTAPMNSWRDFFWQRIRWASKTAHYEDKRVFWVLVFIYFFNVLFFVLCIAGLFDTIYLKIAGAYWLMKTVVEWPFVASVARFYGEQRLMKFFLFFQPVHMLYTVSIGALSQVGKYEWKGRRTH
jgi:cellulose synthase/poly-beta-1,6-N-acetylglucosamine synthase-like glycosyltransferase